jgi:hypothetical protein
MQALVHEVRVVSREEIHPTVALPVVRPLAHSVLPRDRNANLTAHVPLAPIALPRKRIAGS